MGTGLETFLLVGLSIAKADADIRAAEKQAQAVVAQGNIQAKNKAKQIQRQASRAKVSFLQSGLTLEGTPITAIESIFDTGLEDINLIRTNTNTQAKNILSQARNRAILGLASTALTVASGFGDTGATQPTAPGLGSSTFSTSNFPAFSQTLTSSFDSNAISPFQDPFGGR